MKRIVTIAVLTLVAVACAAQTPPPAAQAAPAPAAGVAAEIKTAYAGIKANLTKMAEAMSEENYDFKASPDIRTFGELMQHIADAQVLYCTMAQGDMKRPEPAGKK